MLPPSRIKLATFLPQSEGQLNNYHGGTVAAAFEPTSEYLAPRRKGAKQRNYIRTLPLGNLARVIPRDHAPRVVREFA